MWDTCSLLPLPPPHSRLLLAPPATTSLTAPAAVLSTAGSRANRRHCGFLSRRETAATTATTSWACLWLWAANRSALAPNACLSAISASKSKMRSSLGSLLRNKQFKKVLFSWPLGQRHSISTRSSDGFWVAWDGIGGWTAVPPAGCRSADAQLTGGGVAPCKGSWERVCLHQVGDGLILLSKETGAF